jgi:Na+(H+)/acetate symporter ActP
MIPEEERSDVREMVWEMSRMTNRILIFGIILILLILAALIYLGILTFPFVTNLIALQFSQAAAPVLPHAFRQASW